MFQALKAANQVVTSNCPSAGGVVVLTSEAVPYAPTDPGVQSVGAVDECETAPTPPASTTTTTTARDRIGGHDGIGRHRHADRGRLADTGPGIDRCRRDRAHRRSPRPPPSPGRASPAPPSSNPPAGSKAATAVSPSSRAGQTPPGSPTATAANVQPQPIVAANLPEPLQARGTQTLDRLTALVSGRLPVLPGPGHLAQGRLGAAGVTLATSRPPDQVAPTVGASPAGGDDEPPFLARCSASAPGPDRPGRCGRPGRPVVGLCRSDRPRLVPEPSAGAHSQVDNSAASRIPKTGQQVGLLEDPTIGLKVVVAEGDSPAVLPRRSRSPAPHPLARRPRQQRGVRSRQGLGRTVWADQPRCRSARSCTSRPGTGSSTSRPARPVTSSTP